MFILDHALEQRNDARATSWAASLTMGVGQFCTNPGVVVLTNGEAANQFVQQATAALSETAQPPVCYQNMPEGLLPATNGL